MYWFLPLTRGHPSWKATFLVQKEWPHKRGSTEYSYIAMLEIHRPFVEVIWLVVFYVSSTARSFRDGTPIYCPLQRRWSSVFTPFPPGIEPRAVACQSITLPLRWTLFDLLIFVQSCVIDSPTICRRYFICLFLYRAVLDIHHPFVDVISFVSFFTELCYRFFDVIWFVYFCTELYYRFTTNLWTLFDLFIFLQSHVRDSPPICRRYMICLFSYRAVLENHHSSVAFQLTARDSRVDIFKNLSK